MLLFVCVEDACVIIFHIPVSQAARPSSGASRPSRPQGIKWGQTWGCFRLNINPQIFMGVMRTFEKLWRTRGIQVCIHLDDILLVHLPKPFHQTI